MSYPKGKKIEIKAQYIFKAFILIISLIWLALASFSLCKSRNKINKAISSNIRFGKIDSYR